MKKVSIVLFFIIFVVMKKTHEARRANARLGSQEKVKLPELPWNLWGAIYSSIAYCFIIMYIIIPPILARSLTLLTYVYWYYNINPIVWHGSIRTSVGVFPSCVNVLQNKHQNSIQDLHSINCQRHYWVCLTKLRCLSLLTTLVLKAIPQTIIQFKTYTVSIIKGNTGSVQLI